VLLIHGEKAHSRYFSEDTFKKLKGDNKELMIIPDAGLNVLWKWFKEKKRGKQSGRNTA
jgi:fermentation-respiration switch protein FrsA (DUF1100 family)